MSCGGGYDVVHVEPGDVAAKDCEAVVTWPMSTAGEVDETLAEADDFARRVGTANSTGPGPLLPTDDLTEDLV